MQAVILAAGTGTRLAEVSNGLPKCLLPVGGRSLIEHQLEALADAGIGKVLLIVGYKADEVRKTVGNRVSYLENNRYKETNSLYSLWLARDWVEGPFILMNCDLLFHPDVLHRLLAKGGNALAFDSSSSAGQEQTKVAIRDGKVIDIGKDLPSELARGESLGLMCFNSEGSKVLFTIVNALVKNGGQKSWVMEAVRSACAKLAMQGVNVAGLPWAEIDFPYDLNRAEKEVWPAIHKSRWKKTIRWRTTKWVAVGMAVFLLTGAGWFINSNLNKEVILWTTIHPLQGSERILTLPKGTQQWWMTSQKEPLRAVIHGPSKVRVELRLLLSPDDQVQDRYVVQVLLDGKPLTWEVFNADPDPDAVMTEAIVGDRDRVEFELPQGDHQIEVGLLAGTSEWLLTRIRCPEPESPEEEDEE